MILGNEDGVYNQSTPTRAKLGPCGASLPLVTVIGPRNEHVTKPRPISRLL